MSAILKFDFQKREQLRFSEVNYLNYTKKGPLLHVATTFSLKQGETRKSHGPIPYPFYSSTIHAEWLRRWIWRFMQYIHGFTADNYLSVKPCMLFFIQTLPRILCNGAISRESFFDLFGPIAGVINPIM